MKGSSPRVWGQVRADGVAVSSWRIIPTRMGTSTPLPPQVHGNRDHPHAYGDKQKYDGTSPMDEGSSPRVWGQETRTSAVDGEVRIIPTRMGTRTP